MALFQCTECKKMIKVQPEKCCGPDILSRNKDILCCGRPMMEVVD